MGYIKQYALSFMVGAALACGAPPSTGDTQSSPKGSGQSPKEKTDAPKAPEPTKEPQTHEATKPVEVPKESDLKSAVAQLDAAYQELAGIVKDGDLSKAHQTAEKLSKLSAQLPELAQKESVAAADIEEIKKAAADIEALFSPMDTAGDAGNRELSQKVFAKYEAPINAIKAKVK